MQFLINSSSHSPQWSVSENSWRVSENSRWLATNSLNEVKIYHAPACNTPCAYAKPSKFSFTAPASSTASSISPTDTACFKK